MNCKSKKCSSTCWEVLTLLINSNARNTYIEAHAWSTINLKLTFTSVGMLRMISLESRWEIACMINAADETRNGLGKIKFCKNLVDRQVGKNKMLPNISSIISTTQSTLKWNLIPYSNVWVKRSKQQISLDNVTEAS